MVVYIFISSWIILIPATFKFIWWDCAPTCYLIILDIGDGAMLGFYPMPENKFTYTNYNPCDQYTLFFTFSFMQTCYLDTETQTKKLTGATKEKEIHILHAYLRIHRLG